MIINPFPSDQFTAFEEFNLAPTNYTGIRQAIYAIGYQAHALYYSDPSPHADARFLYKNSYGTFQSEVPTPEQINENGGLPAFCVRFGTFTGPFVGGELAGGNAGWQQAGLLEPGWIFTAYSLWPYDENDNDTYDQAAIDTWLLAQAYYNNTTLNGTSREREVNIPQPDGSPAYYQLFNEDSGATLPCVAATVQVIAMEQLTTH